MKFCDNPKCIFHLSIIGSEILERGVMRLAVGSKTIEARREEYFILGHGSLFLCDICNSAIETIKQYNQSPQRDSQGERSS